MFPARAFHDLGRRLVAREARQQAREVCAVMLARVLTGRDVPIGLVQEVNSLRRHAFAQDGGEPPEA